MAIQDKPWNVRTAVRRGTEQQEPVRLQNEYNGQPESTRNGAIHSRLPRREPHSIVPYKNPGHDLKRAYGLTIQIGLIAALALLVGFFRAPLEREDTFEITLVEQEAVQMEEIRQTKQELRPPPPPRPPVPIEVPNDEIIEDIELNLDASLDISEQISNIPPPPPAPEMEVEEEEEEEIFVIVEQMPEIIGGTEAIYKYLKYPEMARKAGLEGLVVVQVVVETDGRPTDPQVVRSPGPILDEAALEAVMQLRFKPGMQRGKPVRVRYAMPVRFRLNG